MTSPSPHGARPVSIGLTRTSTWTQLPEQTTSVVPHHELARTAPAAAWPLGQRWMVTAVRGGQGRTTVARALGALLSAEYPGSTLLVGTDRQQWSGWAAHCGAGMTARQLLTDVQPGLAAIAPNSVGTRVLAASSPQAPPLPAHDYKRLVAPLLQAASQSVVDADLGPLVELPSLSGPGSIEPAVGGSPWWGTPSAVWVIVSAPDSTSLRQVSATLEGLMAAGLPRHRLVVVLNEHLGRLSPIARSLRTALTTRCAHVAVLPSHQQLAAAQLAPERLPTKSRQALDGCLEVARTTTPLERNPS